MTPLPRNRLAALAAQLEQLLAQDGGGTARATNLMNAIVAEVNRRERSQQ